MNITITEYEDHTEVRVTNNGETLHVYTFETYNEAKAFFQGFKAAQSVINGLVQSLPMSYENIEANKTPVETPVETANRWAKECRELDKRDPQKWSDVKCQCALCRQA